MKMPPTEGGGACGWSRIFGEGLLEVRGLVLDLLNFKMSGRYPSGDAR